MATISDIVKLNFDSYSLSDTRKNRIFRQQVIGHEELAEIRDPLEHERHQFVVAVAGRHQQQSVCLLLGIGGNRLSAKQVKHLFPVHLQLIINMPLLGILENLRL